MIYFLKSYFTVLNVLLFLLLIAYILNKTRNVLLSKWVVSFDLFLLLISSIGYVPNYLVSKIEYKNPILDIKKLNPNKVYSIIVLGSGFNPDKKMTGTVQLGYAGTARLCEAIRIYNQLSHCTIITSGYSSINTVSQAKVTRQAAIELGVNPNRILMLETTSTTNDEVTAIKERFGEKLNLIVSTDALHMERASRMFNDAGIKIIKAPSNYNSFEIPLSNPLAYKPSLNNIHLMDLYIHEVLATIKMKFDYFF